MERVKVFFSSHLEPEKIVEMDGPAVNVDLTPLQLRYVDMGEKHARNMDKFMQYWNEHGQDLIIPKARIALVDPKEAEKYFDSESIKITEEAELLAAVVWTLGERLEKESSVLMSQTGSRMSGFILDVAGSVVLFEMHNDILDWITAELLPETGKKATGEFYPGIGDTGSAVMCELEKSLKTRSTLGVEARGNSMFYPRKTQCTFIVLGQERGEGSRSLTKILPCAPCSGERCLYRQLGGCHLGIIRGVKEGH